MITKLDPPEVPRDDPWKNDRLRRHEAAEKLTKIILSTEQPFVLAVSGRWGSGKTTFLRMWRQDLLNQGFASLHFNAWKTDFVSDPLVAFIGELDAAIRDQQLAASKNPELQKRMDQVKTAAGEIGRRALPAVIKIVSAGVIDADQISDAVSDAAVDFAQKQIAEYDRDRRQIEAFRERLAEFVSVASGKDDSRPLVVFIDELDRCKPTYAIDLLERVKHLFSVPRICFVLGVATDQLHNSVMAVYGLGSDAQEYLRRFIDLDYRLPRPEGTAYTRDLLERFDLKKLLGDRVGHQNTNRFSYSLELLTDRMDMDLRQRESLLARIGILLRSQSNYSWWLMLFFAFLIGLRIKDQEIYRAIQRKDADERVVRKIIDRTFGDDQDALNHVTACLIICLCRDQTELRKRLEAEDMEEPQDASPFGRPTTLLGFIATIGSVSSETLFCATDHVEFAEQFRL